MCNTEQQTNYARGTHEGGRVKIHNPPEGTYKLLLDRKGARVGRDSLPRAHVFVYFCVELEVPQQSALVLVEWLVQSSVQF